jgi:ligand-binding sensor domain-containing protein
MLTKQNGLNEKRKGTIKNSFLLVVFIVLLIIFYIGQGKWAVRTSYNQDINNTSLAGFGIFNPGKNLFSEEPANGRGVFAWVSKYPVADFNIINDGSEDQVNVTKRAFGKKIQARNFQSVTIDDSNVKWFVTESGLVSFNGKKWTLHNQNKQVPGTGINDITYVYTPSGRQIWLASSEGATLASLPVGKKNPVNTFTVDNSPLLSNNVASVAAGSNRVSWIGTDKGISAIRNDKWLDNAYRVQYPEELFKNYPITALATSSDGDSLYAATAGIGIIRVFRDNVDAISGASEYAQWGPIDLPSDNVYSIYIAPDETQWFGTDMGVARHVGHNTLTNWTVFDTDDGLVHNFVQAIAADKEGRLWFGTKGGVSVFDGSLWKSFTENNGLNSNNVLCIAVDKDGVVWIGTDNGVTSVRNGEFTQYN